MRHDRRKEKDDDKEYGGSIEGQERRPARQFQLLNHGAARRFRGRRTGATQLEHDAEAILALVGVRRNRGSQGRARKQRRLVDDANQARGIRRKPRYRHRTVGDAGLGQKSMFGQNTRQLVPRSKDAGVSLHREQTRRGIEAVPTALSGLPGLSNGRLQRGGNAGLAPFEDDQAKQDGAERGDGQQPNRP